MRSKKLLTAFVLFLLFAAISAGLFIYNNFLQTNLSEQNCKMLEEVMQQQKFNFDMKLSNDQKIMHSYSDLVSKMPYQKDRMLEILNTLTADSDFDSVNYITPDGTAFNQDGIEFSVADREYFKEAIVGKTVISDPVDSKIRDAKVIVVATPVIQDGQIVGVLAGSYKQQELDELFLSSFDGNGYAYITTNDGDIIARSVSDHSLADTDNLFEFWKKTDFYMHDDLNTIKSNLYQNKGGHARYQIGEQRRYLHYSTIAVNDWNIFSVVPEQVIIVTSNRILNVSMMMTVSVALLFGLFSLYGFIQQRRHVNELIKIAYVDELTGVYTLAKFKIEAQKILNANPDVKFILVKNDIDNFKLVNQSLGFNVGDNVLCDSARAFESCIKSDRELIARFNVDEFIYLHEFVSQEAFAGTRQSYYDTFRRYIGDDFGYKINFVSGHYYMFRNGCTDISTAIERVNIAHRKAKQLGIPNYVYDEKIIDEAVAKKDIENHMEQALADNEFIVFLQPKYRLLDETVKGAEALVRWKPDNNDMIYPNSFIPLFEENGFITKLDMYMFDKTCALIKKWLDSSISPVAISVNFSRLHLNNDNFVKTLCTIADNYNVPHNLLEIELTESTILGNEAVLFSVLEKLHASGFTLSMDDFGSGYSSLGLLKNLPVDVLKLDRSFFLSAKDNKKALAVLTHMIEMAKDMGIHTVAEGVEIKEHVDLLKKLKCDMVQGYYYAKPMQITEFEKLMSV